MSSRHLTPHYTSRQALETRSPYDLPENHISCGQRVCKYITYCASLLPPGLCALIQLAKFVGYLENQGLNYDCGPFNPSNRADYYRNLKRYNQLSPDVIGCRPNSYKPLNAWQDPKFLFLVFASSFYFLSILAFFHRLNRLSRLNQFNLDNYNRSCSRALCGDLIGTEGHQPSTTSAISHRRYNLNFIGVIHFFKALIGFASFVIGITQISFFYTDCFQKSIQGSIDDCKPIPDYTNFVECKAGFNSPYNSWALADVITYSLGGFIFSTWGAVLIPELIQDILTFIKDCVKKLIEILCCCCERNAHQDDHNNSSSRHTYGSIGGRSALTFYPGERRSLDRQTTSTVTMIV